MTTTKFRNWKTTKNKNLADKRIEKLRKTYPNLQFSMLIRKPQGKYTTSYTIRTVSKKGSKRNA
jgi:pyruvate carboxylase